MEYLGAWGTLIHEKNLMSKISFQTPFKVCLLNENGLVSWKTALSIQNIKYTPNGK